MLLKLSSKHKISLLFITSFILILFSFYFIKLFHRYFNPEKIVEKIQSQVFFKDKESLIILEELITQFNYNPKSIFSLSKKFNVFYKSSGFQFYIVSKSDSLIFWSENSVPLEFLKRNNKTLFFNSGNGWYRQIIIRDNSTLFIAIYLVKNEFLFQNDYLENKFHSSFKLFYDPVIITIENGNDIYSSNNEYLFSLSFPDKKVLPDSILSFLFFIFLISLFLLIIGLYFVHINIFRKRKNNFIFFSGFITNVIIVRLIIFYFKFPVYLNETKFFSPQYYAYSDVLPSIGDFFLHSVFILIISVFLFKYVKFNQKLKKRNNAYKIFIQLSLFLHVFIFYKFILFTFESIILDSKISLDLNDIFSLSWMSFVCLVVVFTILLSFFLISSRLCFFAYNYGDNFYKYLILSFTIFSILLIYNFIINSTSFDDLVIPFLFILSLGVYFKFKITRFSFSSVTFYIAFFSLISAYYLQKYTAIKEIDNRIYLATQLSSEQNDPLLEFQFHDLKNKIIKDELFVSIINQQADTIENQTIIEDYISQNYLSGFLKKYDYQITICKSRDLLFVKPDDIQVNCFSFFEHILLEKGVALTTREFFQIFYDNGDNGYIGILNLNDTSTTTENINIYIELIPKYFSNYLGFPELLVDKKIDKSIDIGEYSYAKYNNFKLHKRVGKYFYSNYYKFSFDTDESFKFTKEGGYNHLQYRTDNSNTLIISTKNKTLFDLFAPFSYLFIFVCIIISIFVFMRYFLFSNKEVSLNLRTRLQLSIIIVILFSFLSIGFFSVSYIINLNKQKNKDILSEKTHSVLVELEHKLSDESFIDESLSLFINQLLIKFSDVFFSDIILFDLNGNMIGSSRPQIFNQKLISEKMNPVAFYELSNNNSSFFIQSENIGAQNYLSAYIPFFNNQSKKIAYLNLPYFAKENDLNREISTFLIAYINIYVILIAISIIIGFLISNYISRPLKLIMNKIGQIKLGSVNEKISWYRDDEIGKLVSEYNRMIDEITQSAELLARSERETAWREMAKQVAHEIKNPLTPMKLGVQHIQRACNEQIPDWNKRLEKFTLTMIEQIDTLSAIASEFSDFAKMPDTRNENFEISDVIQNSIILFKNYDNITIFFHVLNDIPIIINGDKEQLLRVFNNLFKNSIQAIGDNNNGLIEISLSKKSNYCEIEISDNGSGISDELTEKIFSPNFTTKSGGMGLGLAIVKSIINNSGGEIIFTSTKNKGTIFNIKLPLSKY